MARSKPLPPAAPSLELSFWRTTYRYLLSIVASLLTGALWFGLTQGLRVSSTTLIPRLLHLGVYPTIFTGVVALAVGFLAMNFVWLAIDISREAPGEAGRREREVQLFILWMGVPLAVMGVCAAVALLAIVVGNLAYPHGIRPGP